MAEMNQRLDVRLDQKLVMTPQLQLAIKLLQMQAMDLQSFVQQELMENPFLAVDDGTSEDETSPHSASREKDSSEAMETSSLEESNLPLDMQWENMYDSGSGAARQSGPAPETETAAWENRADENTSLRQHLSEQLGLATADPALRFVGAYLVDAIDEAGYLKVDLKEVAQKLNLPLSKVEEALAIVQKLDPPGVAARSLSECLALQLTQENALTPAAQTILNHLELLAHRDIAKLARLAGCAPTEMQAACDRITSLNPKPGLKFGGGETAVVVPDVIVRNKNGKWLVELNAEAMPKVLLNRGYDTFKGRDEEKGYMNERMSRAQWLIKSLEQRARTIHKVATAIVAAQEDFFNAGVENLKPMTLKNIAETVEAHESTVSRVTNGKYMQTPFGTFEMKYFFSAAIGTTGGHVTVAAESVKQMIKRLITDEDARKPLSDEKLVNLLKNEGIDIARRTVAKYRESVGIPSSSSRRVRA